MADEKDLKDNEEFEEYVPETIELDGETFEIIDGICYDGQNYVALVPFSEEDELEGEDLEFIILRADEEKDGITLSTIDDDALYDEVGEAFIEHLNEVFDGEHEDDCDCEECRH